jgi:hypothetical protein
VAQFIGSVGERGLICQPGVAAARARALQQGRVGAKLGEIQPRTPQGSGVRVRASRIEQERPWGHTEGKGNNWIEIQELIQGFLYKVATYYKK